MTGVDLKRDHKIAKLMKCEFKPFGCLVAVQLHMEDEVRSHGGLVMPDGSKDVVKSPSGTVLAVGPEVKQVKVWDEVLFLNQAQGGWLNHGNSKIMMCREDAIIAIVDERSQSPLHRALLKQREAGSLSIAG